MESPKYLIIITLIDGQNFTVPDGALDKIEATVFAEARFGNESILKSDPIKLTNSNPEFVTELAWQLDKKSLHQLRVERKSIKLQIFMQTRERVKGTKQHPSTVTTNGLQTGDSGSNNKVELIGYTIIDIRSAQEREQPKFQWLPLLNPKFRKSSYNRPEVQLAVSLSRENPDSSEPHQSTSSNTKTDLRKKLIECSEWQSSSHDSEQDSLTEDKLYRTCLDFTLNSDQVEKDEILENDINIVSRDGCFYMYDKRNSDKSTIEDCDERYKITVKIPFTSDLETLVRETEGSYYFSVSLLGSIKRTPVFEELTSVEMKEVEFEVYTTHSSILTIYFRLNSNLDIKLHKSSGESIGIASIQLDQLCSFDTKCRSIEGIFALQSVQDHNIPSTIHPSIGASIVLERVPNETVESEQSVLVSDKHIELAKEHFGEDIDDYLYKTFNDTHQLTLETSDIENEIPKETAIHDIEVEDLKEDSHHFRFIIDLKEFSYSPSQRLIPTLRELLVRYSYPFFGYEDTITTEASMPISPTTSIIVHGYCEFSFATTRESLLNALTEIPLSLEILTCGQTKHVDSNLNQTERAVAMCNLNLAKALGLFMNKKNQFEREVSNTVSAPIHGLDGHEIGELNIYLSVEDCGLPPSEFKASVENIDGYDGNVQLQSSPSHIFQDAKTKVQAFIVETKNNLELWKEEYCNKISEELRKRENERFKRLQQRFEVKEAKREQEFKKKMEELNNLEKRYKNSLSYVESLEKKLTTSFDQLKTKDALLDNRLDTLDLKISRAVNNIKSEYEKRLDNLPIRRFSDECPVSAEAKNFNRYVNLKPTSDMARRSSLRNTNSSAGIPVPIRSTSLVRNATEGSTTRLVKRATGVVTTVVNGTSSRPRSNSTRLTLSKETQEKLASLRREKAELLKRGCRPNDELIQEINSLIEKLAC